MLKTIYKTIHSSSYYSCFAGESTKLPKAELVSPLDKDGLRDDVYKKSGIAASLSNS